MTVPSSARSFCPSSARSVARRGDGTAVPRWTALPACQRAKTGMPRAKSRGRASRPLVNQTGHLLSDQIAIRRQAHRILQPWCRQAPAAVLCTRAARRVKSRYCLPSFSRRFRPSPARFDQIAHELSTPTQRRSQSSKPLLPAVPPLRRCHPVAREDFPTLACRYCITQRHCLTTATRLSAFRTGGFGGLDVP